MTTFTFPYRRDAGPAPGRSPRGSSPLPAPARWRDPANGHDWPDTGHACAYCGKPLHPILVAAAERVHELCRPEPVKHWRLR